LGVAFQIAFVSFQKTGHRMTLQLQLGLCDESTGSRCCDHRPLAQLPDQGDCARPKN
jgi:hypothetical protein